MGTRGPKPAPARLKVVRGDTESRINRDEPIPTDGKVTRPRGMSAGAQRVWDDLADDLQDKGCLTTWDVYTFEAFCEAVSTYRQCRKLLGSNFVAQGAAGGVIKSPYHQIMRDCVDVMAKIGSRFGFTPGDRANITIEKGSDAPRQGAERILG